jgi:DNA-binding transcriptional regulator YiaG
MYVAYLYTQCTFREMIKRKKLLLVVPQTRPESTDDFVIRLGTHVTKRSGLVFLKAPNFLPDEIAQIRKSYHWTQRDFASALNVPRSTVSSWESGQKRPSGAALRLLEIFKKTKQRLGGA